MRGFGRHAAGMIVAGVPLTERTPVERRGDARCIAFDKRYCEAMGLIKLDVLGTATLDLLDSAKRYIKESTGKDINLDAIPLDDRKVLDGFAAGYTQGVFQLESGPMRKLLKDLGGGIEPMSFKTIVATTALFRPVQFSQACWTTMSPWQKVLWLHIQFIRVLRKQLKKPTAFYSIKSRS